MATVEGEISRLQNKDQSIRRRAVRNLFDFDNPTALKGFVKLLTDKDQWFRSKAIEAHRKWAQNGDDIRPLMQVDKRIAAEILQTVRDIEIAKELFEDGDHIVRAFSAKILADDESLHQIMSEDAHHSVRSIAAEHTQDSNLVSKLIQDTHPSVITKAIRNASDLDLNLQDEVISRLLESNDEQLRGEASNFAIKKGGNLMILALKDNSPKVRKNISRLVKQKIIDVDERIELIASHSPEIIAQWLKGRHDKESNELRWKLIDNIEISPLIRSKLIEQMEGKTEIDMHKVKLLTQNSNELVKISATNLSASYYELTGEEE